MAADRGGPALGRRDDAASPARFGEPVRAGAAGRGATPPPPAPVGSDRVTGRCRARNGGDLERPVRPRLRGGERGGAAVPGLQLPLAELESLDEGQLTTVLEGLEAPLGAEATPEAPALGDLQDSELERVLRSLEG